MLNICNYTPIVGIGGIFDKIAKNNIIELRGLRSNTWSSATVINKYTENHNNTLINVIEVHMRKSDYKLIDLNYFQLFYDKSYNYEKDIKYIRSCNVNNVKNIYTYEQGINKEEAITNALMRYGIINSKIINQNFKITTHYKNNRLNSKKYIRLWEKDNVIGEFWIKEPNNIGKNNNLISTWEIDLTKKD